VEDALAGGCKKLRGGPLMHCAADVDRLSAITPNPTTALHSGIAFISAAVEPVPPLGNADATLAPGPPFLAVAEPAPLLFALARGALCGAVGDADAFDAHRFRRCLVPARVECGVRRHQMRCETEHCLMRFDGRDQQVRIAGPLGEHFIVDHDLVFGFLELDHLAELVGLGKSK